MAITMTGRFTCTVQDMANLVGSDVTTTAAALPAVSTTAALTNALFTGAASPFRELPLNATIGATKNAGDTITIELQTGSRTGYNARRLTIIVDRIQNFAGNGFLPAANQILETP